MAAHRGDKAKNDVGYEGQSTEKPVYILKGPIATPVVGFSEDVTGEPPAPKMRMAPKPAMEGEGLPMGESSKKGMYINPFGFKNPGGK